MTSRGLWDGRCSKGTCWVLQHLHHHDARRKGYARVVMSALTDWGLQGGAKLGYLQVEGFNQPARALYRQLGFKLCYPYEYYKKE